MKLQVQKAPTIMTDIKDVKWRGKAIRFISDS